MTSAPAGQLEGRVAIVTGAASGIGAATAKLFTQAGATVLALDVTDQAGHALVAASSNLHYRHLDVAAEADWADAMAWVRERFGRVDVLVNNAGVHRTAEIEHTSVAMFDQVYRVNQLGPFLGMRAVIPLMKNSGGAIVNVSSTAGLKGYAGMIAYSGTKFAIRGMTKSAAAELARYNIRVNSVHPGLVYTPMTGGLGESWQQASASRVPLGRGAQPEEIAKLILFVASDAASFSTGAEFVCDGGITA